MIGFRIMLAALCLALAAISADIARQEGKMAGYSAEMQDPEHYRLWRREAQLDAALPWAAVCGAFVFVGIMVAPTRKD
jgi:hypothetical protein